MISQFLQHDKESYVLSTTAFLILSWVSWRVWRFNISPALHPREPKEMPYWVPVIGHAVGFIKDSDYVFTRSRDYFQGSRKPFAITVAGQRIYVVTAPQDVSSIYRNTTTLTFDEFVQDLMRSVGTSEEGISKMYECARTEKSGHLKTEKSNTLHKAMAHSVEDFYRQQLHPGTLLDGLWARVQDLMNAALQWDNISGNCVLSTTEKTKTLSLLEWCRAAVLPSATTAVWGERLLQLQPNLMETFVTFDNESWKLTYKLPRFMAKEVHDAKDEIIATFKRYLALPTDQRSGEAWFIRNLETELRGLGITESDIAAMLVPPIWVFNSNAYKLCFWIMAYLLYDPTLYTCVRSEIDSALSEGPGGLASKLESCVQLVSIYNEILRLNTASASIRAVAATTDLGDVTLSAGAKVLIPYRQFHFDTKVFGGNATQFDAGRFMNTGLSKDHSFRPFGGGTTYCSGRYLAKREVLTFVALALSRYDIELATGKPDATQTRFPVCDVKMSSLGILPPVAGDDVRVVIRNRVLAA